jgi:hypothetical protein
MSNKYKQILQHGKYKSSIDKNRKKSLTIHKTPANQRVSPSVWHENWHELAAAQRGNAGTQKRVLENENPFSVWRDGRADRGGLDTSQRRAFFFGI